MGVLWATDLANPDDTAGIAAILAKLKTGTGYDSVVVRADLKNKPWATETLAYLKAQGVPVYGYVRAPVHYNAAATGEYESAIKNLIEGGGAVLNGMDGKPIRAADPQNPDQFAAAWKVDTAKHAQLTAQMAYDPNYYTGLLIDGLVTNQLYTPASNRTDYMGTGKEITAQEAAQLSAQQRQALQAWTTALRQALPSAKLIGNGSWEPETVNVQNVNGSWKYDPANLQMKEAGWMNLLDGVMDEQETQPYYHGGSVYQQSAGSQRAQLHRQALQAWANAGKSVWIGGRATPSAYGANYSQIGKAGKTAVTQPKPPVTPPPDKPPVQPEPPPAQPYTDWLTQAQKAALQNTGKDPSTLWRSPKSAGFNPFQNWLFDNQSGKVLTTSGNWREWGNLSPQQQGDIQKQPWYGMVKIKGSPGWK